MVRRWLGVVTVVCMLATGTARALVFETTVLEVASAKVRQHAVMLEHPAGVLVVDGDVPVSPAMASAVLWRQGDVAFTAGYLLHESLAHLRLKTVLQIGVDGRGVFTDTQNTPFRESTVHGSVVGTQETGLRLVVTGARVIPGPDGGAEGAEVSAHIDFRYTEPKGGGGGGLQPTSGIHLNTAGIYPAGEVIVLGGQRRDESGETRTGTGSGHVDPTGIEGTLAGGSAAGQREIVVLLRPLVGLDAGQEALREMFKESLKLLEE